MESLLRDLLHGAGVTVGVGLVARAAGRISRLGLLRQPELATVFGCIVLFLELHASGEWYQGGLTTFFCGSVGAFAFLDWLHRRDRGNPGI